ncbi:MAG: type II toxin-antitoxin system PemK/MazF family toxin [bacterium]
MAKKEVVTFPTRGEVYLVDLDPTRGAEIRKTRPALVIQNDLVNRHSHLTIVAAITTSVPSEIPPFKVFVRASEGGLGHDSVILLNQIRSVDKARLVRRVGRLKPATMALVDQALMVSLGLVEV